MIFSAWRVAATLAAALLLFWTALSLADDRTEIALRALLSIAHEPIKPGAQHCNLGGVYLKDHSGSEGVTVGEALLGELAEMTDGRNRITGECRGSNYAHCVVRLSHARGEDVSSTEFRFEIVDGKTQIATLVCISTP